MHWPPPEGGAPPEGGPGASGADVGDSAVVPAAESLGGAPSEDDVGVVPVVWPLLASALRAACWMSSGA